MANDEGGKQFALQNGGDQTCAIADQREFTMIGGFGDTGVHGKVDRCSNPCDTILTLTQVRPVITSSQTYVGRIHVIVSGLVPLLLT